MRRKFNLAVLLMVLVALALPGAALAEHGDPLGGCPNGFDLHHVGHHEHEEHMHHHIGNDMDQNGDGYLCVKHVGANGNNHVHIDNRLPLD